jgi:signal transduction histidine kinase
VSLKRRSEEFAAEADAGPIRRSRLTDYVEGTRDAAGQLVANLHRAGELIQAFKQVAVDRSHADRRLFDLAESVEQVISSLRPGAKKTKVRIEVAIEPGLQMDSYPGPLGQVVTNLFLNAITHAFPDGRPGSIAITGHRIGGDHVQITFEDDGVGMSEEVQRQAFDPFFTTRRGDGGTGLGLHIVYNIVTRRLGGRIVLSSRPGRGSSFRLTLPLDAPRDEAPASSMAVGVDH